MRRIQIPVPPIQEQAEIAAFLNEKIPQLDKTIADKTTQIETLKAYKSSLIYEYVTGKKQVAL
jgi:type I restriction enzyme S subunit